MGPGVRSHLARGNEAVSTIGSINAPAILSLISTVGAFIAFLLMLQEAIALRTGGDPINNGVRAVVRRFPRATYALAVIIGMLIGHLVWP